MSLTPDVFDAPTDDPNPTKINKHIKVNKCVKSKQIRPQTLKVHLDAIHYGKRHACGQCGKVGKITEND